MKQRRTAKAILAAVLAFVFAFATVGPAFAAAGDQQKNEKDAIVSQKTDQDVEAVITKEIRTGETTTLPTGEFRFIFTPVTASTEPDTFTYKNETVPIKKSGHATIGTVRIATDGSEEGKADFNNRVKVVEKQSANFLANLTFNDPGVYAYDVTEESGTFSLATDGTEKMTYSQQAYRVYVYVFNKENSTGTYIKAVSVVYTKDKAGRTAGQSGVDPAVGNKVNPTPNYQPPSTFEPAYNNSEMKFTNLYEKVTEPPMIINPNKAPLEIRKELTSTSINVDQEFTFTVQLKKPEVSDATSFKYAIYEGTTKIGSDQTFALTNGVGTKDIKIKGGQKIVFADTPVGTHFSVNETIPSGWKMPKITIKVGDAVVVNNQDGYQSNERIVGEKAKTNPSNFPNSVQITNDQEDFTPTGIILNNLPFIVMIGGAIVAIVALAVVKSKKKEAAE